MVNSVNPDVIVYTDGIDEDIDASNRVLYVIQESPFIMTTAVPHMTVYFVVTFISETI